MTKKIAILRGINVTGNRIIRMEDLKTVCRKLGMDGVQTYIQSGNVIFNSEESNEVLENTLETAIRERFGMEVPVILRNTEELQASILRNPFFNDQTDVNKLHLTFLKDLPLDSNLKLLQANSYEPDAFVVVDKDIFIYCENKYHQSKLTNNFLEKKLKVTATTRNWKTILKLNELCND